MCAQDCLHTSARHNDATQEAAMSYNNPRFENLSTTRHRNEYYNSTKYNARQHRGGEFAIVKGDGAIYTTIVRCADLQEAAERARNLTYESATGELESRTGVSSENWEIDHYLVLVQEQGWTVVLSNQGCGSQSSWAILIPSSGFL
jgi:hypothetical protein